jgi:hypothetical protein
MQRQANEIRTFPERGGSFLKNDSGIVRQWIDAMAENRDAIERRKLRSSLFRN